MWTEHPTETTWEETRFAWLPYIEGRKFRWLCKVRLRWRLWRVVHQDHPGISISLPEGRLDAILDGEEAE